MFKIGDVAITNSLVLAPMAGVTDLPFRFLCREAGAGLLCTEMVSAKAISFKNKNTYDLMRIRPEEKPISLQLFGSEPELMGEVVKEIEDNPCDIIDINMGCPVPKVVNNGEGSALMKDPKLVGEIVKAVSRATKKPVTIKIRKGFDDKHVNAVLIAKIAEDNGAAAIAIHGRTRDQYYGGKADWDIIRQAKEAVRIPVIGNGDVNSAKAAKAMLEETNCDAIMVGRAVRGNPWIFEQINHYLTTGKEIDKPSRAEVSAMILRHARDLIAYKGEFTGIHEMRKHVAWYTAGFSYSARLRGRVNEIENYANLEELLGEFNG